MWFGEDFCSFTNLSQPCSQEKVYLRIIRRKELLELRHYSRLSNLQSQNLPSTKLWDKLMVDETSIGALRHLELLEIFNQWFKTTPSMHFRKNMWAPR